LDEKHGDGFYITEAILVQQLVSILSRDCHECD